jgi:flagellar biosynthesis component FlhA
MTTTLTIYDEIADFLASLSPDKVLAYHLSDNVKKRLNSLLDKQQVETLTEVERREVEHHLVINNIISLAKARARNLVAN